MALLVFLKPDGLKNKMKRPQKETPHHPYLSQNSTRCLETDYSVSNYNIYAILTPVPGKNGAIVLGGFVCKEQIALFSTSQCCVISDSNFIQCWVKDMLFILYCIFLDRLLIYLFKNKRDIF